MWYIYKHTTFNIMKQHNTKKTSSPRQTIRQTHHQQQQTQQQQHDKPEHANTQDAT